MHTLNIRLFAYLFTAVFFASCAPAAPKISPEEMARRQAFSALLKKFKPIGYPVHLRTLDMSMDNVPQLDFKSADTLFLKTEEGMLWCYGLLPDTSQYYALLYFTPADVSQPALATFTKTGVKISDTHIAVGGCGSDCGFECNETVWIKNDRSIYSADSITTNDCDDNGNVIPGTTKKYVVYKTGMLEQSGKITLTEEMKKDLEVVGKKK